MFLMHNNFRNERGLKMKKSKLLLLLPAACLLCSCGEPGSDFKEIKTEEASKKAKAIEQNVDSDKWEIPSKVTFTLSSSASGKTGESDEFTSLNGEVKAIADMENSYLYASLGGDYASEAEKDAKKFEVWAYKDGDSFISATSDGTNKKYFKFTSEEAATAYDEMLEEVDLSKKSIKENVTGFLTAIKGWLNSISLSVSKDDSGAKFETKFYSKNDGDLKATYKGTISTSSTSYETESTYVISNYLPAYAYSKASGKNGDADFSAESKMLLDWGKADTGNKPNLKDFQESK